MPKPVAQEATKTESPGKGRAKELVPVPISLPSTRRDSSAFDCIEGLVPGVNSVSMAIS